MNKSIAEQLAIHGIYGPGSDKLATYERHLTRFFEREYKRIENHHSTSRALGVFTDRGAMSLETNKLMDYHYDEQREFFNSFLDTRFMAYTMAFYGETPEEILASKYTLEEAQLAKFALIAERAGIEGHEHILNIGCGFAPLETFLLKKYPKIRIVGITPSNVQAAYINERKCNKDDPLCTNRFTLIKESFENITLAKEDFDTIITIGLFEHVVNIKYVMNRIHVLLKPNGKAFHHFITSKYPVPKFLNPNNTRIGKYFPGGHVWPADEIIRQTGDFNLEGYWFVNGLNYWRTLEEWHRRYWASLEHLYGSVFDIKAVAHWNEYFSLCKVVFAPLDGTFYGNSHYLFSKSR
jgi:cyclopropane-fatty-acyl-phospholipid synthase